MRKEVLDDLELMRKIRDERAKEMEQEEAEAKEIRRLEVDGIRTFDELIFYIRKEIQGANNLTYQARDINNTLLYAEANGVKREFKHLLELVLKGDEEDKKLEVWGNVKEPEYGMEVV